MSRRRESAVLLSLALAIRLFLPSISNGRFCYRLFGNSWFLWKGGKKEGKRMKKRGEGGGDGKEEEEGRWMRNMTDPSISGTSVRSWAINCFCCSLVILACRGERGGGGG